GRNAEEKLHGADQADGAVILMNESAGTIVGADDEGGRAMGVHVVGAVLRVVFEDENGRVVPIGAGGNLLDEKAEGVVIVRDVELRGGHARPETVGVIVGQIDDVESGKRIGLTLAPRLDAAAEFLQPTGNRGIPSKARIVIGAGDEGEVRRM